MFMFSPLYWLFVAPALLLGLYAQMKVKSAFGRFSRVRSYSGMTGAQAARHMLEGMGIRVVASAQEATQMDNAVAIEQVNGFLSDHYDPRSKVLRLSRNVYGNASLAAVGVACHEAGHALQHAHNYAPLAARGFMVPVASFGSWAAFPIILLGAFFNHALIPFGIALYAALVLFQLVTLPVEYNASKRAKAALVSTGIIRGEEEAEGVASVLDAAALTYVAAALSSIMTLLYILTLLSGGRD